uniref:Uncharacterized protein n=1 Tax=Arundo donax TaxID=35708 RepID=A0A0A9GKF7_ARUDO
MKTKDILNTFLKGREKAPENRLLPIRHTIAIGWVLTCTIGGKQSEGPFFCDNPVLSPG